MFNLEQAIQNWKQSLKSSPSFESGQIKEMETHLRDEIDARIAKGLSPEDAFEQTVEKFGTVEEIGDEVYKTKTTKVDATPPWKQVSWILPLLPNYFKVAYRNVQRNKGYTFINLFGFSLGLISCLLISIWIIDELKYDSFHQNADHIYRVITKPGKSVNDRIQATTANPVAPVLKQEIPQVLNFVRFRRFQNILVRNSDKAFYEDRFFYADSTVFDVFDFELLQGNPKTALSGPGKVVITEAIGRRYFGSDSPVGERLQFNGKEYEVTGLLAEIPEQVHFKFDFLASFSNSFQSESWSSFPPLYTYLLTAEGTDKIALEQNINRLAENYIRESEIDNYQLYLQPLKRIHLYSDLNYEIEQNGSITYVYLFSIVALFILFLATINYINLATAKSAQRTKEVGLRKVMGAEKIQLVLQFLGEAVLYSIGALLISILVVWIILPYYNSLIGKSISLSILTAPSFLASMGIAVILIGLIAGLYPAIIISRHSPATILKGPEIQVHKTLFLRGLVSLQFVVCIVLISGAIVIYNQLDYIFNSDVGFAKERIVVINTEDTPVQKNYVTVKGDLLQRTDVINASASLLVPAEAPWSWTTQTGNNHNELALNTYLVDYDFIDTYDMKLVAGRSFDRNLSSDSTSAFIINETAVREFGWTNNEDALGKEIIWSKGEKTGKVIGIVKDFHLEPMHKQIAPVILTILTDIWMVRHISVKFRGENYSRSIAELNEIWNRHASGYPFNYFFLEDFYNNRYQSSINTGKIVGGFSILAIFIACLGLLGIISFTAERRKKEIGIRKVHGATVKSVLFLLSGELFRLVAIAFFVAVPIGYLIMSHWLDSFAYHIKLDAWIFIWSGLVTLLLALTAVSYQTVKAALMNPIKSLRSE